MKLLFILFFLFSLATTNCITTHVQERAGEVLERKTRNIGEPTVTEERTFQSSYKVSEKSLTLQFQASVKTTAVQKQVETVKQNIDRSAFTNGNLTWIYAWDYINGNKSGIPDTHYSDFSTSFIIFSVFSLGVQIVWSVFDFATLPFRSIDRTEITDEQKKITLKEETKEFQIPEGSFLEIAGESIPLKKDKAKIPLIRILSSFKDKTLQADLKDPKKNLLTSVEIQEDEVYSKINEINYRNIQEFVFTVPDELKINSEEDTDVRQKEKNRKIEARLKKHNSEKEGKTFKLLYVNFSELVEEKVETEYARMLSKRAKETSSIAEAGEILGELLKCGLMNPEKCSRKTGRYIVKFPIGKAEIHLITDQSEASEFKKGHVYSFTCRFKEYKQSSSDEPILVVEKE